MLVWRCPSPPGSGIREQTGVEFGYISELGRDPAAAGPKSGAHLYRFLFNWGPFPDRCLRRVAPWDGFLRQPGEG